MTKKEINKEQVEQEKIKKEKQAFVDEYKGLTERHGYCIVSVLKSNTSSIYTQLEVAKIEKKSKIETV